MCNIRYNAEETWIISYTMSLSTMCHAVVINRRINHLHTIPPFVFFHFEWKNLLLPRNIQLHLLHEIEILGSKFGNRIMASHQLNFVRGGLSRDANYLAQWSYDFYLRRDRDLLNDAFDRFLENLDFRYHVDVSSRNLAEFSRVIARNSYL